MKFLGKTTRGFSGVFLKVFKYFKASKKQGTFETAFPHVFSQGHPTSGFELRTSREGRDTDTDLYGAPFCRGGWQMLGFFRGFPWFFLGFFWVFGFCELLVIFYLGLLLVV